MHRKVSILILALFLLVETAGAQSIHQSLAFVAREKASSYSDITWEHNCDALGDAQIAVGSATVTYDAGILLNESDQTQGTGCFDSNDDDYDEIKFNQSGNFSYTNSRIGFHFNPQELSTGRMIEMTGDLSITFTSGTYVYASYRGSGNQLIDLGVSTSTWYYIELEFNNTVMTVYVNDVEKGNATGSDAWTSTTITFFAPPGRTAWDYLLDRMRISNDHTRDLYAIKDINIS